MENKSIYLKDCTVNGKIFDYGGTNKDKLKLGIGKHNQGRFTLYGNVLGLDNLIIVKCLECFYLCELIKVEQGKSNYKITLDIVRELEQGEIENVRG